MTDFAAAGDYRVLPSVDDTAGGRVRMHVSIAVGSEDDVLAGDVDLALAADGQGLAQLERPANGRLGTVTLGAMAAIAFFVFDNPDNRTPTRAVVTVKGSSASFDFGPPLVA